MKCLHHLSQQWEKAFDSQDKAQVLWVFRHRWTTSLLLWLDRSVTFETTTPQMKHLRILKRLWNFHTPTQSRTHHDDQRSVFTMNAKFYKSDLVFTGYPIRISSIILFPRLFFHALEWAEAQCWYAGFCVSMLIRQYRKVGDASMLLTSFNAVKTKKK